MEKHELSALAKTLVGAVREYVSSALVTMATRLDAVERTVKEIPAGRDGIDGKDGKDGRDGIDGLHGKDGESIVGPAGPAGKDGESIKGDRGEDGIGFKGDTGDKGEPGPAGERGLPGERGEKGESIQGERGLPGESIKGDKGDVGPSGERGPAGERGEKGLDGAPGIKGDIGERGPIGEKGMDGQDGRDALELDILSSVDLSKSYAPRTFAQHNGGLIRSFRTTDAIVDGDVQKAGWQVILAGGVQSFDIIQSENLRTFTFAVRLFNGELQARQFTLPVLIHRGVFQDGDDYEAGDAVSFAGSVWGCLRPTKSKPGDGAPDWKLIVKRGRDGKDGQDGKPGERGLPGKDGR